MVFFADDCGDLVASGANDDADAAAEAVDRAAANTDSRVRSDRRLVVAPLEDGFLPSYGVDCSNPFSSSSPLLSSASYSSSSSS